MDEQLYRTVRQRVMALVALFELEEDWAIVPMLELELRFGVFGDRGQFVAGLPNGLWYALFQYMSQAPTARVEASFSMVELDQEAESARAQTGQHVRIVHVAGHRECVRESKRALVETVDVPLFGSASTAVVRVATSRETRLGDNVCSQQRRPSDIPRFAMRYRERRSIYLVQDNKPSCWRFDFTRIDDKSAYELEIEFDLREALLQTPGAEQAARSDAIMRQLDSLIASLRHALEQADRTHRTNVAQIVAKRQEIAARLQQHV